MVKEKKNKLEMGWTSKRYYAIPPSSQTFAAVANCYLWSRVKPWITEGQVFQNYDKSYIVQKWAQPVWPQDHFHYTFFEELLCFMDSL